MAIGCSRGVDGILEPELADDCSRTEVEQLAYLVCNLGIGDYSCPLGVDIHAHRLGDTDRLGDLDHHLFGHSGRYHILGNIPGGVGCAAVHLGRVLAGEGSAAMG